MKKKYLIVTIEGGGNMPPILSTIRKLKERGHAVILLSEPWFEALAETIGVTFIPFREYFTKTNRYQDILNDWKDRNNSFRIMFEPGQVIVKEVVDAIRTHGIDVVIADVLTPTALIAAEVEKIPGVVLFHMPEYLPAPNRPPGGLGLIPVNHFFGRLRNRLLIKVFNLFFDRYLPGVNAVREKYHLKKMRHITEMFHNADLRIIMTSKAFDFPIIPAPSNLRYTGPILDDPDWTEKWEYPWPSEDQRPLVVVGFSSTFQNQKRVIDNCIMALSKMPVRGLVTLGPALETEAFHSVENVKIIASGPHSLIFPYSACVITHGGHGTVIRALSMGVPMVCLPMGRDQNDNAAKVAYHGAGIRLSHNASSRKIRKAVSAILSDPSYKENARIIGIAIKQDAGHESIIPTLESIFED